MRVKYELMACVDCLAYVANGELPEETDFDLDASIVMTIGTLDAADLSVGDSAKDEDFSSSACECCGSILAGSRHQLMVLES